MKRPFALAGLSALLAAVMFLSATTGGHAGLGGNVVNLLINAAAGRSLPCRLTRVRSVHTQSTAPRNGLHSTRPLCACSRTRAPSIRAKPRRGG